jgi:hypothetical protein
MPVGTIPRFHSSILGEFLINFVGRGQGNFWYTEGRSSVKVMDNMAFVEAGDRSNRAMAVVSPRTELVYVDREIAVPTTKPLHKSERTCCIVLLVLVILAIIAAVAIGVGIHEANKSSGY